jgi:hypothetical protein
MGYRHQSMGHDSHNFPIRMFSRSQAQAMVSTL